MKKNITLLIIILASLGILGACKKSFFDIKPKGSLSQDIFATKVGVDGLLVGAYAMMDGVAGNLPGDSWDGATTDWLWGSVRALEANKGSEPGDQAPMNEIQTFTEVPTNAKIDHEWIMCYEAISRCNSVISAAKLALSKGTITSDDYTSFLNQARAVRGWFHFKAWRLWKKVPYVSEHTDPYKIGNQADVSDSILADLHAGATLPNNMGQIGRFNGTVSEVILGKALMEIKGDYAGALVQFNLAKAGTKPNGAIIGLDTLYGEIFDAANKNGIESIYTVQYSVNDGAGGENSGAGEVLNFPYKPTPASPGGCCGFFVPNQDLVNSFRVDANGLPLLDGTYDTPANAVKNDEGVPSSDPSYTPDPGLLDPRVDWTTGRREIPFWDWGPHTGMDWTRNQGYAGPYTAKKQVYKKSEKGSYTYIGAWTDGYTSNGYRMIRYADLLLLIAECQIKTGDFTGARTNINAIRARAQNPRGFVQNLAGTGPAANYLIGLYPAGAPYFDTEDNAMKVLMMERKLELGTEGHRWFDLNRWGVTKTELSRILTYQLSLSWGALLYGAAVVNDHMDLLPVPQDQIDLSQGLIVQNR